MSDGLYNWGAFLVLAFVLVGMTSVVTPRSWPAWLRSMILTAMIGRIVGSFLRIEVLFRVYGGRGDAVSYYQEGLENSDNIWLFDFDFIRDSPQLWGTDFIRIISAFMLAIVGPSLRAEFLIFSVFPLVGLVLILRAFASEFPDRQRPIAGSLLLWPSLLFWPSSVGKEAIIMLGSGLVIFGYVGHKGRPYWPLVLSGLALAVAIRPHIGMMFAVCVAAAEWLAPAQKWTPVTVVRSFALSIVALFVVRASLDQFGLDEAEISEIQDWVTYRSGRTAAGGSAIDQVSGAMLVPMAFVNALFRPFIWESGNPQIFASALEVLVFWALAWPRRSVIWQNLKGWRNNRLLRFALPLLFVLILFYGGFVSNLGILVRQRVVFLPFLFVFLYAPPAVRPARAAVTVPSSTPRPIIQRRVGA